MVSCHRIVDALVGETPLQTEGSTSRRLKSDFFLDQIAVSLPQWENSLTGAFLLL
jgi:hypothetical protein